MWRVIDCWKGRTSEPDPPRDRPSAAAAPSSRPAQYQAPVVTPPLHTGSVPSYDQDNDFEQGALLPKRSPEPAGLGPSSSLGAREDADQELTSHRRAGAAGAPSKGRPSAATGVTASARAPGNTSGGHSGGHRRTRSSGGQGLQPLLSKAGTAAALTGTGAPDAARAVLLAPPDSDDDDCCPTCLEAYTHDNPKTWTRCGHHYHLQCIYEWLERKDTCPMCESKMVFEEDVLMG